MAIVTFDALRNLVPSVQFKKREKHPRRSITHEGACNFTRINTPPWVFFTFLKLYKWYQIAQRTTFFHVMTLPENNKEI